MAGVPSVGLPSASNVACSQSACPIRLPDALGDPAVQLALDDRRIHDHAEVVDGDVAADPGDCVSPHRSPAQAAFGSGDQRAGDIVDGQTPSGVELVEAVETGQQPEQVGGSVGGDVGT